MKKNRDQIKKIFIVKVGFGAIIIWSGISTPVTASILGMGLPNTYRGIVYFKTETVSLLNTRQELPDKEAKAIYPESASQKKARTVNTLFGWGETQNDTSSKTENNTSVGWGEWTWGGVKYMANIGADTWNYLYGTEAPSTEEEKKIEKEAGDETPLLVIKDLPSITSNEIKVAPETLPLTTEKSSPRPTPEKVKSKSKKSPTTIPQKVGSQTEKNSPNTAQKEQPKIVKITHSSAALTLFVRSSGWEKFIKKLSSGLPSKRQRKGPYWKMDELTQEGLIIRSTRGKLEVIDNKDTVELKLCDPSDNTKSIMSLFGKKSDMKKGFTFTSLERENGQPKMRSESGEFFSNEGAYKVLMQARSKAFNQKERQKLMAQK